MHANNGPRGRHHNLTMHDIAFLTTTIRGNPTIYLDELQHELQARRSALYLYIHSFAPCVGYITATISALVLANLYQVYSETVFCMRQTVLNLAHPHT